MIDKKENLLFIISSPSGAGKSTICKIMLSEFSELSMSVSVTTRKPRHGEVDGLDYIFKNKNEYDKMVESDMFLEHAKFCDNYYGTPIDSTKNILASGKNVLFDIDVSGSRQIFSKMPQSVVRVFILPPSISELERRLIARSKDNHDVIQRRLEIAKIEMECIKEYDYVVINDDLEKASVEVKSIYIAEKIKRRNIDLGSLYI
jgi:guanylate kinase